MVYYLARRHLSMSPQEWDALPWWQEQMYLDGFEAEELVQVREGSHDPSVKSEQVHQSGSTTIVEREHSATFSGVPGELASFGFSEQTIGG